MVRDDDQLRVVEVPLWGVVAIAVVTFLAQLAASSWWLQRHPYGPVEWLLRAATNAHFPRWRRSEVISE